jgi:hypothetical protein
MVGRIAVALRAASCKIPKSDQTVSMAESIRCRVGLHSWQKKWDTKRREPIRECRRCGLRVVSAVPPASLGGGGGFGGP